MNSAPLHRKILITNPNGLHMRPSAAFVQTAERFQSCVTVTLDGKSVNGKSIWDLMLLGACKGSELTLEVEGPDASDALDALASVLSTIPPSDEMDDNMPAGGSLESA